MDEKYGIPINSEEKIKEIIEYLKIRNQDLICYYKKIDNKYQIFIKNKIIIKI
jgi:hypothetical protein